MLYTLKCEQVFFCIEYYVSSSCVFKFENKDYLGLWNS